MGKAQKYIAVVAGARPNFMKVDPLLRALKKQNIPARLIHTGQHYDHNMSAVFFQELGIREPDAHLEIGSGSHAVQTAGIMVAFEKYCLENPPEWTIVAGDVNSTVGCSLVAAKLGIKVAHLEAGLRSFDWTMPEEINRVVTDRLSDVLLTPSADGDDNLRNEGVSESRIFRVGNIMIDTLFRLLPRAKESKILEQIGVDPGGYFLGTFHRPSNVDTKEALTNLVSIINESSAHFPFVLPLHPRTRKMLIAHSLLSILEENSRIKLLDPIGYLDFAALSSQARVVLTDSGGIQEETTAMNIPCLTLRENTERPITVTEGTNQIVGSNPERVLGALSGILDGKISLTRCPELWDGKTGKRCAEVFERLLSGQEPAWKPLSEQVQRVTAVSGGTTVPASDYTDTDTSRTRLTATQR